MEDPKTILLRPEHRFVQFESSILSWSSDFSDEIVQRLGIYGWTSTNNLDSLLLKAPSDWTIGIESSNEPYSHNLNFVNPRYKIFFFGTLVCDILTRVGRYSTWYQIHWKEQNLSMIDHWLSVEKQILDAFFPKSVSVSLHHFLVGKKKLEKR